jgi:protein TonB
VFEHVEGIRSRNRRGTLPAAGAAALVHVLLVALLAWGIREKVLLAVEPSGDGPALGFPEGGGGGGGGSGGQEVVSYVDLTPPPPQPEPVEVEPVPVEDELVPPEPTPVPEPPKPETPQVQVPDRPPTVTPGPVTAGQGAGTGGGDGAGQGPGTGPGVGPGSGGGTGGGDGGGIGSGQGPGTGGGPGRIRPPATDLMLIPPDKPGNVTSQEITVRLTVDDRGRVRDARLTSSTGNRGYDERLRRWALTLVFRPAVNLDTNRPVEAQTEIKVFV